MLLALERRRISIPRLRTTPIFKMRLQQGFATGEMGGNGHFAQQQSQRLMSALGLGRFKTFRQKRFKLRETVNEPFFEFGYARIAAISGWMPMMFITRVRL